MRDATAAGAGLRRLEAAPYRSWGLGLDPQAVDQMENAVRLPVAVRAR